MFPNRFRKTDLVEEMKTAIPPNGVMARCVSRRINRSSDNRAVISRAGLNCPSPLIDW
jgi:hypothetical protein